MMAEQADLDVSISFGSVENRYFTTSQLNFSDRDEVSLKLTLGEAGALHVDNQDDARRWTVLISLSHNPPGYWPGRTLITALRTYAVMAFGTLRNQWEYLAVADAYNKTRVAIINPNYVLPTATEITNLHQWREGDDVHTPRVERIQMVLDGNAPVHQSNIEREKEWKQYTDHCYGHLSQRSFMYVTLKKGNKKVGQITWTNELGSTFWKMNPNTADNTASTKGKEATTHELFGSKPFACNVPQLLLDRAKTVATLKAHFRAHRKDFPWVDIEPSMDPDSARAENNDAAVEEDQTVPVVQDTSGIVQDEKVKGYRGQQGASYHTLNQ